MRISILPVDLDWGSKKKRANIRDHAPAAIAGDFNAWAADWDSKKNNGRGIALLDVMSTLNAVLLNIGSEPTYEKDGKSSIVDLTFFSSSLTAENNC